MASVLIDRETEAFDGGEDVVGGLEPLEGFGVFVVLFDKGADIGAVGVEDLGRGVAEAQALFDDPLRDPEAGGDIGDGGAVIGERAEGLHLVGRVHGDAHHVLRERELAVGGTVVDDAAGHGMVGGQHAVAGEIVERGEPAGAGDNGIVLAAVLAESDGACNEVLKQPVDGDGGLELGEGGLAGLGPADVGGRALEAVERDGSDDGVVHVVLRNACMGRWPEPSTAAGLAPNGQARTLRAARQASDQKRVSRCSYSRGSRIGRSRLGLYLADPLRRRALVGRQGFIGGGGDVAGLNRVPARRLRKHPEWPRRRLSA